MRDFGPEHVAFGLTGDQFRGARVVTGIGTLALVELPDLAALGRHEYRFLERPGGPVLRSLDDLSVDALSRTATALREAIAEAAAGRPQALHDLHRGFEDVERGVALELMRRILSADAQPPLLLAQPPLAGDDRDLDRLRVRTDAGGLSLVLDGTVEFPLLLGNAVFPHFEPGWGVRAVITRLLPYLILELEHADGHRSTWVLDEHLVHRTNEWLRFEPLWDRIRAIVPPLMRAEWERVFNQEFTTAPDPIFRLHPWALHVIFQNITSNVCPTIEAQQLGDMPETRLLPPAGARREPVVLRREHVARALGRELFEAGIEAVRGGRFTWPSPVDGSDAVLEAVYPLQEYTIFYQFLDRNGLRFIVPTGDRDCVALGLFFPDSNLVLGDVYFPDAWLCILVGGGVWHNLLNHVFSRHALIGHSVRKPDAPIHNVFMGPPLLHIGHYVWNDLSGQSALIERLGSDAPPSVVYADADRGAELFGPLEELFPPLEGKVNRDLPDKEAFCRWAMQSGAVPIRFTRNRVPAGLRRMVRERTVRTPAGRAIAQRLRDELRGRPIVIAGIRLEDRTLADNDNFFAAMLDHLRRHHPGTVVVFDGRNARAGSRTGEMISGITDNLSGGRAGDAELAFVARLRERFAGSGISIESTIGAPTEASLAWCFSAHCCVALWGAGMAKYRWLANLPTLALSSHYNLTQRRDYGIYHEPAFMDDPAPMLNLRPDQVTDLAGRTGLVQQADRVGSEIFTVQQDAAFALLDTLMALPPREPAQDAPAGSGTPGRFLRSGRPGNGAA